MTQEELEIIATLQAQMQKMQNLMGQLIDKVTSLEAANNVQNFINEVNSNTTTNDTK